MYFLLDVGEYERILKLLEPGEKPIEDGLYVCARIAGLDKHGNFKQTNKKQLLTFINLFNIF